MAIKKKVAKSSKGLRQNKKGPQSFIENEFLVLSIVAAGGLLSTILLVATY